MIDAIEKTLKEIEDFKNILEMPELTAEEKEFKKEQIQELQENINVLEGQLLKHKTFEY